MRMPSQRVVFLGLGWVTIAAAVATSMAGHFVVGPKVGRAAARVDNALEDWARTSERLGGGLLSALAGVDKAARAAGEAAVAAGGLAESLDRAAAEARGSAFAERIAQAGLKARDLATAAGEGARLTSALSGEVREHPDVFTVAGNRFRKARDVLRLERAGTAATLACDAVAAVLLLLGVALLGIGRIAGRGGMVACALSALLVQGCALPGGGAERSIGRTVEEHPAAVRLSHAGRPMAAIARPGGSAFRVRGPDSGRTSENAPASARQRPDLDRLQDAVPQR
ncbi:MAG: hypothetical protein FJ087_13550 [Deltaproteobacteria bacterium]|nr:hypothetical protein [Deltaproteobacteria bacterium]